VINPNGTTLHNIILGGGQGNLVAAFYVSRPFAMPVLKVAQNVSPSQMPL
jgi:hypothetical protein